MCGFQETTLWFINQAQSTIVTVKPRGLKQMFCESLSMWLLITGKKVFNSILVVDNFRYSTVTEITDSAWSHDQALRISMLRQIQELKLATWDWLHFLWSISLNGTKARPLSKQQLNRLVVKTPRLSTTHQKTSTPCYAIASNFSYHYSWQTRHYRCHHQGVNGSYNRPVNPSA